MNLNDRLTWRDIQKVRAETIIELSADDLAGLEAELDVIRLVSLSFRIATKPWQDGSQVDLGIDAVAIRTCGISLDSFEERISGVLNLRFVPEGSLHLPVTEHEIVVDLDENDPPELLPDEGLDLRALLMEMLTLELSAFPRKQGVIFNAPEEPVSLSPFSALSTLNLTSKKAET